MLERTTGSSVSEASISGADVAANLSMHIVIIIVKCSLLKQQVSAEEEQAAVDVRQNVILRYHKTYNYI